MTDKTTFISMKDVDYVAALANLSFSDEEKQDCAEKLGSILDYMQELQKIDTTGVEHTTHALPMINVFREDEIGQSLPNAIALANAPEKQDNYFKVPKIL